MVDMRALVVGLIVLLAAPVAHAAGELQRGIELYRRLKYERARTELTRALEDPAVDRVEAYLYLGLTRMQLGDESGGRAAFREALALDRTVRPPAMVSPKVRVVFDEVAQSMPRPADPPPAPVVMQNDPPGVLTPTSGTAPPAPSMADKLTRWPVVTAGVVAVSAAAIGLAFGLRSNGRDSDAQSAAYASEARRLHEGARADAHRANGMFIGAGAALAFGLVYGFAF